MQPSLQFSLGRKAGFDPRRGGEGAGRLFGLATYFGANASKSDIYSESFTARMSRRADRKLLISRLALGSEERNCRTVT